jgi:predicted DNA-binding antitoxin AbrB/MazE fold protein
MKIGGNIDMEPIKAIYENGILKLLDPIELQNGEVVTLSIQRKPAEERVYLCANERYTVQPEDHTEIIPLEDLVDHDRLLDWEPF